MAVLVTSLAVLVIIAAAKPKRKILMSKPPGLRSSSPSFQVEARDRVAQAELPLGPRLLLSSLPLLL